MSKIIIIGAGIAGLAACAELRQQGFDAIILEARSRYGGRIYVDHSLGIPLPRGAHWVHGTENNPLTALIQQYQTPLSRFNYEQVVTFDRHHQPIPEAICKQFEQLIEQAIQDGKQQALHAKQDYSLAVSLAPFVEKYHQLPYFEELFTRKLKFFKNYMGADYTQLSARYWDMEQHYGDDNYLTHDAYQSVIDGLANQCDIHLDQIVTSIQLLEKKIHITTQQKTYAADYVICTLPLGVLQRDAVSFDPPLPIAKQQAITRLGMGTYDIMALQFSHAFWPANHSAFFIHSDNPLSCSIFFNAQPITGRAILLGYMGADTALNLENMTDTQVMETALHNLRSVFGKAVVMPDGYYMTRWGQDPFSYGSYSYIGVNATPQDLIQLAEPVDNRLLFAGEAAGGEDYSATVVGAYLSGMREARRIVDYHN